MTNAFASNERFFKAVREFADRLNAEGHSLAAGGIKDGLSLLNGLTDGWAMFGESLEGVRARHSGDLTAGERAKLDQLISAVDDVVRRR